MSTARPSSKGRFSPKYEITIDDQNVGNEVYSDILQLEVEDNETQADTFSIRISYSRGSDGKWHHSLEDKLQLFSKIVIAASFPKGDREYLIEGYVTSLRPHFDKEEANSYIEIKGMDATVLMNLKDKLVSWFDKTDSEIAKKIFSDYGFEPVVEDTINPPRESGSAVIQRGSDILFLKMLADRNGFECYVEKDFRLKKVVGYFQRPKVDQTPQKDLAIFFGKDTNTIYMDAHVDALKPLGVEIIQTDALKEEVRDVNVNSSKLKKLGKQNLSELVRSKLDQINSKLDPKVVLSRQITSEPQLMEKIASSVFDNGSWFINVNGMVDAVAYGSILKAKRNVLISGAGDSFSGEYYISKVIHRIKQETYFQEFEAKRNAIGLEGSEAFGKDTSRQPS